MRQDFASSFGAEFGQQLVKANSTMTVSIFVGAIAERNHPIGYSGKVGLLTFKTIEQRLCIVGDVALSVRRSTNQKSATVLKDAGIEAIHSLDRDLMASRLQRLLHFLGHHLGRAGHGSDQNRNVEAHAGVPHPGTIIRAATEV